MNYSPQLQRFAACARPPRGLTLSALCLLGLHSLTLAKPSQTQQVEQKPALQQMQGVWWERCGDPAAALAITGKRYGGDFVGEHPLKLTQRRGHPPLLTFTKGLPFGHSVHVSGRAESFEVVKASATELVLSPTPGASRAGDWTLKKCQASQPQNELPPALRGWPPKGAGSSVSPPVPTLREGTGALARPIQVLQLHNWRLDQVVLGPQGQGTLPLLPDPGEAPVVTFEALAGQEVRLVVTKLCNGSGGIYRVDGDRLKKVDGIAITAKLCPERPGIDELERAMHKQVNALRSFQLTNAAADPGSPGLELRFDDGSRWQLRGTPTRDARYGPPERMNLEVAAGFVPCNKADPAPGRCFQARRVANTGEDCPAPLEDWQVYRGHIEGFEPLPDAGFFLQIQRYTDAKAAPDKRHIDVMVGQRGGMAGDINKQFGTVGKRKPFNFDPCRRAPI